MLWASQVAPGNENGLKLRVYGTKGGLEWAQEDPNYLWFTPFGEPKRLITRGGAGSGRGGRRASPACRPAIRRAISKASPTSTRRPPRAIRAARDGQGAGRRGDLPDRRGRREGRGLRRRLRALEQAQRRLGAARRLAGEPASDRCGARRCARACACARISGTAVVSHSSPRRSGPIAKSVSDSRPNASRSDAVGGRVEPEGERVRPRGTRGAERREQRASGCASTSPFGPVQLTTAATRSVRARPLSAFAHAHLDAIRR